MRGPATDKGHRGFDYINGAVVQPQKAGFGFGAEGASPGRFYEFDQVRRHTPDDPDINTRWPDMIN